MWNSSILRYFWISDIHYHSQICFTFTLPVSMDACYCAQQLSHARLFVMLWTVDRQAPLSMGILQARIVEWVATSFSKGFSWDRDRTLVSCTAGGFFTTAPPGKPISMNSSLFFQLFRPQSWRHSCLFFLSQPYPTWKQNFLVLLSKYNSTDFFPVLTLLSSLWS